MHFIDFIKRPSIFFAMLFMFIAFYKSRMEGLVLDDALTIAAAVGFIFFMSCHIASSYFKKEKCCQLFR
jgi:inosine-uridine nucleoside N-ribohydrolase